MFIEISRINESGEKVVSLINTEDVAYVHELHQEPVRLYNEDGDLVSETKPTERKFSLILVLKNQHHVAYVIDENQYTALKKTLTSTSK